MNRNKFLKSLGSLSGWRESLFILGLAERGLPNLQLYATQLDMPEENADLDQLMGASWEVFGGGKSEDQIGELLDQALSPVDLLIDDPNYGASPSLDCLWLWEQALASELNAEVKRAEQASQRSLQTVTQFIEFSEGEGISDDQLVKLFDKHNLVEREWSFQMEMSDTLRAADRLDARLIRCLRELAQDEGVSNIGISLD